MTFADLGLSPELLRAVSETGYTIPTPIQSRAIPAVLAGRDVLAGAQTGTGKTAAFVLPILQRLSTGAAGAGPGAEARPGLHNAPRALVLTPTRELAAQVAQSAREYGKYARLRVAVIFGGVGYHGQIATLRKGCDILVATPGRLLDLQEQRAVDLSHVQCLVLDEADRMLDMGFSRPIRKIVGFLPKQRQNLLFSATYSDEIRELARAMLRDPETIEVATRNATADLVDQQLYRVPKEQKRHLLAHLIIDGQWSQVLVFGRTKHGVNRLAEHLEGVGIRTAIIHGNKSQNARVRALADFKAGKVTVLAATEVAARGLDIKDLPHVVNFELPSVPEDYVHRIGRTGRAGGAGSATSLVSPDEGQLLTAIERLLRKRIPELALPKFEVRAAAPPVRAATPSPQGKPAREVTASRRARSGARAAPQRNRRAGARHGSHASQNAKGGRSPW